MDQLGNSPVADREPSRRERAEGLMLPSRVAALESLRRAVAAQAGPVLVTGEAGVGKTWLWRRLRSERSARWRWVSVDLTPTIDPAGFYRLLGHGLGLPGLGDPALSRAALSDHFRAGTENGVEWTIVIDEAQNLSEAVGEEVRILANRQGHADGPAAIILAGQTPLSRRLMTLPLASLGARISARVSLRPLDFEEACTLLRVVPAFGREGGLLDRIHRDTGGNPRRLMLAAGASGVEWSGRPTSPRPLDSVESIETAHSEPDLAASDSEPLSKVPTWDLPVVGPARPPLREEEGVIEVGWEPSSEAEPAAEPITVAEELPAVPRELRDISTETLAAEETVDDHYAALRAWSEWAKNQGRSSAPAAVPASVGPSQSAESEADEADESLARPLPGAGAANVWAEGQHGFAPYSQLFSRLRQSRDSK